MPAPTTLPKVRETAVRKAWASFPKDAEANVSLEALAEIFDALRHPLVLKHEATEDEVFNDFFGAFNNGTISEADFIKYYTQWSADVDDSAYFVIVVTRVWQLDQPCAARVRRAQLQESVKQNFATSAYHGLAAPPQADHAAGRTVGIETAKLSVDPFPMPKAGVTAKSAQSYFDQPCKTHHHAKVRDCTQLSIAKPEKLSTAGSTGLHGSFGFMETQSRNIESIGKGELDQPVIDAYQQGKAQERAWEQRRKDLQAQPFRTAEPASYERSSQIHGNLTAAVNRERPAHPVNQRPVVSDEELREVLEQQRADVRVKLTHSRPRVSNLTTTQRDHFVKIDEQKAKKANDRLNAQYVSDQSDSSAEFSTSRGRNGYDTEYSTSMQDRSGEAQRETKFDARGTFRLVNGVPQMSPLSHHPRDVKVGTGSPSSIVPDQFRTTTKSTFA